MEKSHYKIAILDMYEGVENQGMRCIKELINLYADQESIVMDYVIYDIRRTAKLPDLSYDFYISSGGPGSPIDSTGTTWENNFFEWLKQLEAYNTTASLKKHALFICHSFQLVCKYYNVGNLCNRKSTSFGVFPVHTLLHTSEEPLFNGMKNPFYIVDSRDYQVIDPNFTRIKEIGGTILAIEKERPHVPLPRAIMAMRFNPYFIGTQFHPEADPVGMSMYLQKADRKEIVVKNHGLEKWENMVEHLADPDKIVYTYNHIIPNFFKVATNESFSNR
jgi:homoserine O-succinyltransferase/O-acetyltransferase